jgi:ATP-binding cassette, subfamily F, member 3
LFVVSEFLLPMILLTVRELSRQFDVDPVFRDVTFDVRAGEKIGLVGPNGTGKTTLLKILGGQDEPDTGQINRHSGSTVAILEQDARFAPERTLIEEAKSGLAHLYELQHQAIALAEQMASVKEDKDLARLQKRYDDLQHELEKHDAYHIDHRVDEVLTGLGFTAEEYDRPLNQFSGGQQNRVLLARLLLRAPDVMLLDEPTNHLDIAATEWLESWLAKSEQAVILVSHDRYFLDRVTTRILEMHQARVTDFKGNFSAYWQQREERAKVLERTYEKQQEFIAKTEDFIRRNKYGQKHAQASDREKKLERLDRVEQLQDFQQFAMGFSEPARTGDWVIDAVDVSKGFTGGEPLFRDFTMRINREDRIGILGPNGSGKTTLLRTLIRELEPDTGTIRFGTNVKIAYYDQQLSSVNPNLDAVEAIRPPDNPDMTPGTLRSILARFGIRGDQAFQQVGSMSGGERSKVALARIAALDVNLLILDEPTNHLDLWARSSLEDTLKTYQGTLLFVSHDRYFLDRVATSVIVLGQGEWKYYEGNYSDYVAFLKNRTVEKPAEIPRDQLHIENPPEPEPEIRRKKEPKRKRKFPYRKVADLELEIAEYEELVERLQADLADPNIYRDGERVKETMEAFEDAQERLEELYEHWEEAVELN